MGVVWIFEVGVSLPIDASDIYETFPESSLNFAESNSKSFVFLCHGESPQINFFFEISKFSIDSIIKKYQFLIFFNFSTKQRSPKDGPQGP